VPTTSQEGQYRDPSALFATLIIARICQQMPPEIVLLYARISVEFGLLNFANARSQSADSLFSNSTWRLATSRA
jgi:hypothetical protein